MFILKEQGTRTATLECIARYILSIVVDKEIDAEYKFGKPMNEYEYDNNISDFKLTSMYIFSSYSSDAILQSLKVVIRETIRANKEKLIYAAGAQYTDRFVYVFNEKTISERDVRIDEGCIVFGDGCFTCFPETKRSPPLKYFARSEKNEFESIGAIIVDSDDIFDLPHGYKSIDYPLMTDLRLHKQGRLLKPLWYDPTFGINTYLFKKKYPSKYLYPLNRYGSVCEIEEIHWVKWENLNLKKYFMSSLSDDLKNCPNYAKGERVYCALTGIEITGDCYIFEIYDVKSTSHQIVVAPIFDIIEHSDHTFQAALNYFKYHFRWLTLRSYCPTPVDIVINEVADAADAPLLRAIESSIEPVDTETFSAKNADGSPIIMKEFVSVTRLLKWAETYSDKTLLIYDASCISGL